MKIRILEMLEPSSCQRQQVNMLLMKDRKKIYKKSSKNIFWSSEMYGEELPSFRVIMKSPSSGKS